MAEVVELQASRYRADDEFVGNPVGIADAVA
jgi:hypothetical protein